MAIKAEYAQAVFDPKQTAALTDFLNMAVTRIGEFLVARIFAKLLLSLDTDFLLTWPVLTDPGVP